VTIVLGLGHGVDDRVLSPRHGEVRQIERFALDPDPERNDDVGAPCPHRRCLRRMNALIEDLIVLLPAERTPALLDWRTGIRSTIERTFPDPQEQLAASREDRQGLGGARVASGGKPA
jgi:hypothetical protein